MFFHRQPNRHLSPISIAKLRFMVRSDTSDMNEWARAKARARAGNISCFVFCVDGKFVNDWVPVHLNQYHIILCISDIGYLSVTVGTGNLNLAGHGGWDGEETFKWKNRSAVSNLMLIHHNGIMLSISFSCMSKTKFNYKVKYQMEMDETRTEPNWTETNTTKQRRLSINRMMLNIIEFYRRNISVMKTLTLTHDSQFHLSIIADSRSAYTYIIINRIFFCFLIHFSSLVIIFHYVLHSILLNVGHAV